MRLTSQCLPELEDVSEEQILRAFDRQAFGKFVHIWRSDTIFLQAGSRGTPSSCAPPDDPLVREIAAFIERTGSEPWTLEYVDRIERKDYRVPGSLTLKQVEVAFVAFLRSGGEWRQGQVWEELDTRRNPFPNPQPDEAWKRAARIPNEALTLDHIPPPDADGPEVWRFADTFDGFGHWGSFERCQQVANQRKDSSLAGLRTCLFFECRRWHHFGKQPDTHDTPAIRNLVESIRQLVASAGTESNRPAQDVRSTEPGC